MTGVVALAGIFLCYGTTELVEGYGFIAVAVASLTIRRIEEQHKFHRLLHDFSEAIEQTLTAFLLVALGAVLPALLQDLTLTLAIMAVVLLLVVRPVVGWLALAGSDLRGRDRWVVAIYGVRGIGSIYYLAYAAGKVEFVDEGKLWALVGFTILLSTLGHGMKPELRWTVWGRITDAQTMSPQSDFVSPGNIPKDRAKHGQTLITSVNKRDGFFGGQGVQIAWARLVIGAGSFWAQKQLAAPDRMVSAAYRSNGTIGLAYGMLRWSEHTQSVR